MPDRDLILGVLGVQAGFVTPTQVMAVASSWLVEKDGPALLTRLESFGGLTPARRALLESLADEAVAAANGDVERVLDRMGGTPAIVSTFGTPLGPARARTAIADDERAVPEERPGQYTRLGELGRGGQSIVRRAIDELVGREVALKELATRAGAADDAAGVRAARARFLREARLVAQLDHPGIVAVHELARRPDGTLFCSQKLVRGETLKARLARCESLDQRLGLLECLIDASHAVAYAHSRGVLHRDLKPSNIMVGAFGETVVVDWGLAKRAGEDGAEPDTPAPTSEPGVTVAGVALGTPAYMSPEQARGALADITEQSDVFSLGVILYELLTARLPFEGATAEHVIEKVRAGHHARVRDVCPEAPSELAAVAERALSPDPAARYAGAEDLATELLAYRRGGRVKAYEYGSWELLRRFVARNRAVTVVSALAVVALFAAALVINRQLHEARGQLAASFLERARAAEQSADWARAAGYYAASRLERDSREGRWGFALAAERMPRRVMSRRGADQAFAAAGYLADGRAIAVALEPPWVIGRELDTGRELWRYQHPGLLIRTIVEGLSVRLVSDEATRFLDLATGKLVDSFVGASEQPCVRGPTPARVRVRMRSGRSPELVVVDGAGAHPLPIEVVSWRHCAVSPQGDRVAALDVDGVVHVFDVATRAELVRRRARDASNLLFTGHGLAVVRAQSIEVIADGEDHFVITLPEQRGNGVTGFAINAIVSPDGHLLALPRLTSSQLDIIDLRPRRLVASVSFAPGLSRLAISPAGDRMLIAGLLEGSLVTAWDLRPRPRGPEIAGAPAMEHATSEDGHHILVIQVEPPGRAEIRDQTGRLLRVFEGFSSVMSALSEDATRIAFRENDQLVLRDARSGALISQFACSGCEGMVLSADGRRILTTNGDELVLWDAGLQRVIWRERERAGAIGGPLSISGDGQRVMWGRDANIYLRTIGTGDEEVLKVDSAFEAAVLSNSGTKIAVVTRQMIGVWDVDGLRPVFRIPNPTATFQDINWSADDATLINWRDGLDALLFDAETGHQVARIAIAQPTALGSGVRVAPSLRYSISRGDGRWSIDPLPAPDDAAPGVSLARVLADTGLELHGVELVYAEPPR